ncbi:MAG: class I SAM-dependent methyltransferase [Candidatus Krumholzibacteria bacterium]|nr:class I SAM-dependent methyltransferase [Candidatus Krumholzibacteria bacterium]
MLQDCVRSSGEYMYLEIGSHLGGTIQPHFIDPACKLIYSIDKRPESQPDERGRSCHYTDNSTERMLSNLSHAFPSIDKYKIVNFDNDASDLDPGEIIEKPTLCFIDGEHTNQAVFADFKFCLQVSHANAIIAFHDTCYIFKGIKTIKEYLSSHSIQFRGFMVGGSVYVILLNEAINNYSDKIEPLAINESEYFRNAGKKLRKVRFKSGYPRLYRFLQMGKRILKSPTKR